MNPQIQRIGRAGFKDIFGRLWPYPKRELCPTCGQPDSCGDCNHKKLPDEDVLKILGTKDEV